MADLDTLVENYFREKEDEIKIESLDLLKQTIDEVYGEFLLERDTSVRKATAKEFILSLPKMVPTEAWGDPNDESRKEMDKFFRSIGGGADVAGKIQQLRRLQEPNTNITSPKRIISTLILLESLAATMNSFGDSSTGFVFEGFLAGLLGGRQVTEKTPSGNLPIADIIAFTQYEGSTDVPMSLKVLRQGNTTKIKGSYTNLVDALLDDSAMKYIVAYKDQEGDKVSSIQIEEFDITRENLLPLLNLTANNRKLITLPGKTPEYSYKQLSKAKSWEELYPMLQRTQGYTKKLSTQKQEENPGTEDADTPAETDNDRLRAGIDKIFDSGDEKKIKKLRRLNKRLENAKGDIEANYALSTLKAFVEDEMLTEAYAMLTEEQLLQEAEGKPQWYTNYSQLKKNKDVFRLKSLGALAVSPEALEKTAEQYMDILQGRITTLFRAVSELSKNINSYFTSTEDQRKKAMEDGNKAIQNADQIADSMEEVTKQDTEN